MNNFDASLPRTRILAIVLALALVCACARGKREPLPGDSVSLDGAVAIAPASMPPLSTGSSAPITAAAREPLGAVESRLFPPELVMERQGELGLDDRQRKTLVTEIERAQGEMTRHRWDLEREREALVKLLEAEPVDEVAVAASAKRMTDVESRIKAVHLAMLVRVKNALTPAQKLKLRSLRAP